MSWIRNTGFQSTSVKNSKCPFAPILFKPDEMHGTSKSVEFCPKWQGYAALGTSL
jgi:hypothetical protein